MPGRAPAYIQTCGGAASPSPNPGLFPFPACPHGRVPGPRIPIPGRLPLSAVLAVPWPLAPRPSSPVPPPVCLPLQRTNDKQRMTVVPRWRVPRPCSPFPVPCSRCCLFASSYPQQRMRIRACKKPSNSIKFESKSIKKATFSVKKASKRRAFRHAHLNILGVDPLWR